MNYSLNINYFIPKNFNFNEFPRPNHFKKGLIFFSLVYNRTITGIGEANIEFGTLEEFGKISKLIFPFFVKKKLENINLQDIKKILMRKKLNFNCLNSCIAALSQCLINIIAEKKKIQKLQVYDETLIKKNKIVNVYASGGMFYESQDTNLFLEEALKYKEKNFFGYKFRPPFPKNFQSHSLRMLYPPPINSKKIKKISTNIRKNVGDEFHLMIDLGCRVQNTIQLKYLLSLFKELNFYFVEEPVKRNLSLYENYLSKIPSKSHIASCEHISDAEDAKKWIQDKNIKFVQFDTNSIDSYEIFFLKHCIKKSNKIFIPHNWSSSINTSSALNLLLSLNQDKNIIEKNIYYSPFQDLFINNDFQFDKNLFKMTDHVGNSSYFNKDNFSKFFIKEINIK